ncbi:hypothetical protein GCM10028862_04680 [Luteimonas pelagia]
MERGSNDKESVKMNEITLTAEAAMLAANASASALDAALGVVEGASQTAMCSDCCVSNGNSCAPTLPK